MNIHIENAMYEVSEMFSKVNDMARYPNYPHAVTFTTVNDKEFLWVEDFYLIFLYLEYKSPELPLFIIYLRVQI